MISLDDRVANYFKAFPRAPEGSIAVIPTPDGERKISGVWEIGRLFRGSEYYGSFPGNFLKRAHSLFPDVAQSNTLHLFSGSLPAGEYFRIDGLRSNVPDSGDRNFIEANAELFSIAFKSWFLRAPINLIIVDPPYTKADAIKYGWKKLVNYRVALGQCHKVLEPGGWLLWFATRAPICSNEFWRLALIIPVYCGSNKIIRCLWGFQKKGN